MMRLKFNPLERAVGFFIVISVVGTFVLGLGIAVKKNWLEDKVFFYTYVKNADNIRVGASVFMGGLKIGKIEDIEFDDKKQISVKFNVLKKYAQNISQGSEAHFSRPFVIGDKVLNIVRNENSHLPLHPGSLVKLSDKVDVIDVLSGDKVHEIVSRVDHMMTNLDDLVATSNSIAHEVHQNKQVEKIMRNVTLASDQLKHSPQMVRSISDTLKNLKDITHELNTLRPVIKKVATKFPEGANRVMKLLNESVTTVKALQKNYFLRDYIQEVREEENQQSKNDSRSIAGKE